MFNLKTIHLFTFAESFKFQKGQNQKQWKLCIPESIFSSLALLLHKTAGIRVIVQTHSGKILLTVIMFTTLELGVNIRIWQFFSLKFYRLKKLNIPIVDLFVHIWMHLLFEKFWKRFEKIWCVCLPFKQTWGEFNLYQHGRGIRSHISQHKSYQRWQWQ